ncbi:MAG: nucleotidyl transferase AbiEii/AbiGii toxin family protein [Gemmatimonadetes bacterium]|nr:nucleotidyl transferase AbiEii/AbiGii toxin family protein [Gemmatimonadota bacterium]
MANRTVTVPLTDFQRILLALLARTRTPDSYLAGGAALHFTPNSVRYSRDLDFFHDSTERVASAFAEDEELLKEAGYSLDIEISQPGFIRAVVLRGADATRIDWAHDSAWRFMPVVRDAMGGYVLHDIDLAINKTLALAGRDEPRDFVDILFVHEHVLPLAGLTWATVGKDPGFSPLSLLELLKRRGRHRPEEMARLDLVRPFDPVASKETWLAALEEADTFANSRPVEEGGCLYYSVDRQRFVLPQPDVDLAAQGLAIHWGAPGGVIPRPADIPPQVPPKPGGATE